jgi:hypothetical protein
VDEPSTLSPSQGKSIPKEITNNKEDYLQEIYTFKMHATNKL